MRDKNRTNTTARPDGIAPQPAIAPRLTCKRCKQTLPADCFYTHYLRPGRKPVCKQCFNMIRKAQRKEADYFQTKKGKEADYPLLTDDSLSHTLRRELLRHALAEVCESIRRKRLRDIAAEYARWESIS